MCWNNNWDPNQKVKVVIFEEKKRQILDILIKMHYVGVHQIIHFSQKYNNIYKKNQHLLKISIYKQVISFL